MKYEEWIERMDEYLNEGYKIVLAQDMLKVAILIKDGEHYKLDEDGVLTKISDEEFMKIRDRILKEDDKKGIKQQSQKKIGEQTAQASMQKSNLPEKRESGFHIEEFTGIPRQFLIKYGDEVFVRRAGLLFKAEKKGFRALQVELQPLENEGGFIAKATLYPKITKEEVEIIKAAQGLDPEVQKEVLKNLFVPFVDYATATPKNVKTQNMLPYLRELASTRASNRVLRMFVACGFTSYEETPDYREIPEVEEV